MSEEVELPPLVVKTGKSEFRLRCHAAAWAAEYGGTVKIHRRYSRDYPGLLLLSATGPDTAAKAVRATLYQPDVEAEFALQLRRYDGAAGSGAWRLQRQARGLQRRRGEAGPRRDPPGRPGEDTRPDAQHERRPPVDRTVRAALHHAAVASVDGLAQGVDGP